MLIYCILAYHLLCSRGNLQTEIFTTSHQFFSDNLNSLGATKPTFRLPTEKFLKILLCITHTYTHTHTCRLVKADSWLQRAFGGFHRYAIKS